MKRKEVVLMIMIALIMNNFGLLSANPTEGGLISHQDTLGYAQAVYVSENYAYVADREAGLAIIDISDPTNPGSPIYQDINSKTRDVYVRLHTTTTTTISMRRNS